MDDEDLRAYQEYMLHGAKPSSNTKTPTAKVPCTTSPPDRSISSPRAKGKGAPSSSPRQKHLRLLRRSFQSSVRAWVETDDQLLQVSRSVANLRDRIWITSRALIALREEEEHRPKFHSRADRGWMEQGYRPSAPSLPPSLPEHVLHVALSDALVQHERMLALFRQLMSQLSQDQDALGRRAEDLFLLQVQEEEESMGRPQTWSGRRHGTTNDDDEDKSSNAWETDDPAQGCIELHAACARELYRKQRLAQLLVGSTTNAMLHSGTAADDTAADDDELTTRPGEIDEGDSASQLSRSVRQHPRSVASFCARTWSRASRASELFALRETLLETASSE
jgi:hypothetical protein